jgi:hypothetical protein
MKQNLNYEINSVYLSVVVICKILSYLNLIYIRKGIYNKLIHYNIF